MMAVIWSRQNAHSAPPPSLQHPTLPSESLKGFDMTFPYPHKTLVETQGNILVAGNPMTPIFSNQFFKLHENCLNLQNCSLCIGKSVTHAIMFHV